MFLKISSTALFFLFVFVYSANGLVRDPDIPSTLLTHVGRITPIVTPMTGPFPAPTTGNNGREHVAANGIVQGLHANTAVPGIPGSVPGVPNNGAVAGHLGNTTVSGLSGNGVVPRAPVNHGQQPGIARMSPHSGVPFQNIASPYTGPLSFLLASDSRAEVFADSFLFWLDTVEMVRVASHTAVYFSGWALPVYLFCFLSTMRIVLTPHSPLLSPLGVLLQDLPFLVMRMALIGLFGFVTPLLYVMKNLLVCLAYIYFNFMTKLRIFNTERLF